MIKCYIIIQMIYYGKLSTLRLQKHGKHRFEGVDGGTSAGVWLVYCGDGRSGLAGGVFVGCSRISCIAGVSEAIGEYD